MCENHFGGALKFMLNKVEICGVNTSKLPVLTNEEKDKLFKRIKQGDKSAREEFVQGNLRLVLSVLQRFTGRGENVDDLFQVGCIGLIKSIDNFNTELNVQFSTYAVPMIIGEIRRYLRDNNSIRVSRSLKDIAYKALSAKEKLTNESEREPTVEEIAKAIDIPKKDVVNALCAIQDPMSLFEPIYNDNGDAMYVMDQVSDEKSYDENWIEEIALKEAMKKLNDREKHILNLRFFKGKTQIEVAQEIGVSCNELKYSFKRNGFGNKKGYEVNFFVNVSFIL